MIWHPIETAPERRHVLIGTNTGKTSYSLPVKIGFKRDGCWGDTGAKWTHWAEIPEPPK